MSNCRYCGKPAGFLKSSHPECEEKCMEGKNLISRISFQTVTDQGDVEALKLKVNKLSQDYLVPAEEVRKLAIECWEKSVDHFLKDGVLTDEEEKQTIRFANVYDLTREELERRGFLQKIVKSTVLREVSEGIIIERVRVEGLNLNLQKGEKIIWLFNDTDYYENNTLVCRGNLGVTNKNLYFIGGGKALRIPFAKIITFTPFQDGIGIQKDGVSARPQRFITHDGWFTNKLISSISKGFRS